jgi:hypothetical protein
LRAASSSSLNACDGLRGTSADDAPKTAIDCKQVKYRLTHISWRIHNVLVHRPETHIPTHRQRHITVTIPNMGFPTIMREPTIGFNDQTSLDDHVYSAHPVDDDLKFTMKSRLPDDHAQQTLLTRLGTTIEQRTNSLKAPWKAPKNVRQIIAVDVLMEQRAIYRSNRVPQLLATGCLGKSIHDAHSRFGYGRNVDKWQPVQLHTFAIFGGQGHGPVPRASRS